MMKYGKISQIIYTLSTIHPLFYNIDKEIFMKIESTERIHLNRRTYINIVSHIQKDVYWSSSNQITAATPIFTDVNPIQVISITY